MLDFITPDPVAMHARLRPAALACIDLATGRRWSYGALDADILRAVRVLAGKGISRGERVAVIARNCVDLIVLQQALMRLGAIFVPLNWRLSLPELARLLADCTPKLVYTDFDAAPVLPEGCWLEQVSTFIDEVRAADPAPRPPRHSGFDTCIILYTSGTSGVPKGALLTSQFLLATAVNFNVLGEVDTGCVFLCDSPMFHVIGIVTQIWPPILRGGTFIVSPGFDPEATNERLGHPDWGVTHYFCVPQMAEALRHAGNFDPSRWRRLKALFTGGAPNPPSQIRWWLDHGVKMVDGYGMTETGTTLGMPLSPEMLREKAGAVGVAGPLTSVSIVDENDEEVPDGVPGEVVIFGLNVTPGYWNRPEERDRAFTPEGGLRSGDIGVRDADGYITIVDRRKDMFISGGENVYPVEVEAALIQHDAVREVAVIGIPDERWGEVGCAYIVPAPGQAPQAAELVTHCRSLIAHYKVPKDFRLVPELPRTGSGKVMKHVLRDTARAEVAPAR
ncbi:acyl-CoA synthetase [Sinirhodobacter ferrireducens]|uniref:3-methylmercaptopropionyl-CoA ligase n=1 Tax=Paenirhodobacter ferrireducens TaxID=1215032 RepID=A0A443LM44_9RHOB|nr:AMP-binding protein [Sinirhodobacter ferrireducens]RWR50198.1 acyl-CoA synthetase [Sinirhodobacter ferrireducens]